MLNLFTHGALRSSQELVQRCPCIHGSNWNLEMLVLRRGDNWSTRRKTSRSRVENQQQTQPTYDARSGNQSRATLVGGKRSHHCAVVDDCVLNYFCSFPSLYPTLEPEYVAKETVAGMLRDQPVVLIPGNTAANFILTA